MSSQCPCGHVHYGYKLDSGILSKLVERSEHQLRHPPAWCVQQDVVDYHVAKGEINRIEIYNTEPPYEVYLIDLDVFMEQATPINRGHGDQYMVPLKSWQRSKRGANDQVLPKQLGMFTGE